MYNAVGSPDMPVSLTNAPATFQRLMQDVLHDMDGFVGVYIDDVVNYSMNPSSVT